MKPKKIRLLVVDDHPAFRFGLVGMLQGFPDIVVVAEAADGQAAVETFRRERPDVVLMDLRLPRLSGVQAILEICREFPDAKAVVLTTFDADEDIYRAIQSGAKSYLLKDASRDEIADTVRAVFAGGDALPASVARLLSERLDRKNLTSREQTILELVVKGRSNKEIASELGLAEITVRVHLTSIFKKLDVLDRTQAAIEAIRHGIVHLE